MKRKTIICSLFALLLLIGCKNEPQYSRFENHNVPACGIADPLNNLPWLKAYCSENYNSYSASISIYKNTLTDENHIIIKTATEYIPNQSPSPMYRSQVYNCEGVRILYKATEGTVSEGWDAFFLENTLVAKIWEVKEN